jgi:WD40 repeat protein
VNCNWLAIGNEEGAIQIVHSQHSSTREIAERSLRPKECSNVSLFRAHDNALFTLKWYDRDSKVISGSGDQSIRIHDVVTGQATHQLQGVGSVKCIDTLAGDDNILISGSRDGKIYIWDIRTCMRKARTGASEGVNIPTCQLGNPSTSFAECHQSKGFVHSVTSLKSIDHDLLVSGGDQSDSINFW